MKKVITYGTFDLMHYGHIRLLERAKQLGDYLVVGVTSDKYDKERGKLNVQESLLERIANVKKTGLADEIIVEEYEGQKIIDIQKNHINIFAIGSDWKGKFDYLNEYCEVVYLERTKGISSTLERQQKGAYVNLGIIGSGKIAKRFIKESKFVSGANVMGVYNPHLISAIQFADEEELEIGTDDLDKLLNQVDAVYIASPHQTHYKYIKSAINKGKHVLCEKPIVLKKKEAIEVYSLAKKRNKVLMCAIKTAYCPAFEHVLLLAKSGRIGTIKDIEATFTKLICNPTSRELKKDMAGGSVNELLTYPLLPVIKLLGNKIHTFQFYTYKNSEGIDLYTKMNLQYFSAVATIKVGLGVKSEGDLIISGTRGYIYVPAPWWKTNYFEMRFENLNSTEKYFYKFEGDGLRYELVEFISQISNTSSHKKLTSEEIITITDFIEKFSNNENVIEIK